VLSEVLSELDGIDLLFMDANHRYQTTMDYFRQCLPLCKSETIVVIDDIYWSPGMTRAWKEIKEVEKVGMTIDLFQAGVVLFRNGLGRKHYILPL
jgi:predicted O-methyltransferase YrrM